MRSSWGGILLSGLAMLAAAWWLRYGLVEREGLELLCAQAQHSRCALREMVIAMFAHNRLGYVSLAAAALALLPRLRLLAWLGWLGGIAGLVLYCFDTSAPATLLSLLLLAKTAAASTRHSTSQA